MADETTTSAPTSFIDNIPDAPTGDPQFLDSAPPAEAEPAVPVEDTPQAEPAKAEPESASATEPVSKAETEPKSEVATTEPAAEPAVEAAPALPDTAVVTAALVAAAKALGITETDPAKIPALIEQKQAEAVQARQEEAVREVEADITSQAQEATDHLIDQQAAARLKGEGYELTDGWHLNPENAAMLERFYELRGEIAAMPEWQNVFNNAVAQGKTAYQQQQAVYGEIETKYDQAPKALIADLKRFGFTPDIIDAIARQSHEQVNQTTATLHSAVAAKDAELETLRAQVSGHADAVAKAKTDGIAEGRNAALEVIKSGRDIPATTGLGGPTTEQAPGYKPTGNFLGALGIGRS
jgi:hypothetical protein